MSFSNLSVSPLRRHSVTSKTQEVGYVALKKYLEAAVSMNCEAS